MAAPEILKRIAPALRAAGFRGSGQNYRKLEDDFVCHPEKARALANRGLELAGDGAAGLISDLRAVLRSI